MPPLKIVKFPDPVLRKRASSVEAIRPEERVLVNNMIESMYLNQGVGLAAPQVGVSKRILVLDIGEGPSCLINPIITKRTGSEKSQEGCLSLPGVMVTVKRAKEITYKYLGTDGALVEKTADGLLARAVQHEIDHLDGKVILDHANPIKRYFLRKKILEQHQT